MTTESVAMAMGMGLPVPTTLRIAPGHTVLLDAASLERSSMELSHCLSVAQGLLRVAVSGPDVEALDSESITLGFLQAGDRLPLDLLRRSRFHLEALTPVRLEEGGGLLPPEGATSLHDWTVALLLIRHLGEAEQRLAALLQLLVERLGHRCGDWYELPLHLSHQRLAELVGHTRVTVTRQLSKWRQAGLVGGDTNAQGGLRLAPDLVEA